MIVPQRKPIVKSPLFPAAWLRRRQTDPEQPRQNRQHHANKNNHTQSNKRQKEQVLALHQPDCMKNWWQEELV